MFANEVWPGKPYPLGATYDGTGVNFAVASEVATRIEVCLYDAAEPTKEIRRFDLPETTDRVKHGYVPGLRPGTLYGLRVHGPYDPERGHRCNPAKLLVDPYAKALHGEVDWSKPVHGYKLLDPAKDLTRCDLDSADGVPRSVVVADDFNWGNESRPDIPWRKTIIYEVHVKGFTMKHPAIPPELRGTYAGMAHPASIEHLKMLGVTAVELLPVHENADDSFLGEKGLYNYWGYNTLGFFAPEQRYASTGTQGQQVNEFKQMVKTLHAAGIEVLLDVVYNHTCEGNHLGATLSLKGIDNATYYWLMPDQARYCLDFTGCGNSLNVRHPTTIRLIMDSLRYWVTEMHVDGFRFDLASVLGRTGEGAFDQHSAFFQILHQDPVLSKVKLISEPWDIGLGGYQVGNFPPGWREWNGKYRDAVRKYWRGDENLAGEMGYRITGSPDLYEVAGRRPQASINFVTAHDGFTLHDLVTYSHKHNEANGEHNRDGSDDNQAWNCGVEGETDDPAVNELRERQKRNLLTTLILSQGVPMLLGGDEIGRTQGGNNNGYCQDNEISWFNWELDDKRKALLQFTRKLIRLRQDQPVLQRRRWFRGEKLWDSRYRDLAWFRPDGSEMTQEDWEKPFVRAVSFLLGGDAIPTADELGNRIVGDSLLVMMNAHHEPLAFTVPGEEWGSRWEVVIDTANPAGPERLIGRNLELAGRSMVVLRHRLPREGIS
jgi:glycogen operon protein